ncbi:BTAD domain-containing putative transcriptional regulator [Streptomyces sp. B6B3]|uniref:AfsR/SARP family transcriptional regulator n=1 Tax=Streptomyces sp. B6B3 TaxID=3153570 RepID=UPI00325F7740
MGAPDREPGLQEVEELLSTAVTLLRPYLDAARPSAEAAAPESVLGEAPDAPAGGDERPMVEIRCFGGFRVTVGGTAVDCGAVRPKARSLLRLLALRAGSPVHRDVLLDALWPDLGHEAGVRNLHVTVSRLRTLLEPGAERGSATLLTRDEHSYGLALGWPCASDVREFDRRSTVCLRPAPGEDPERRIAALRAALRWYGGELLPEEGAAEWVVGERRRLRGRAARLCATLAGCELELGRPDAAAAAAEQALTLDAYLDEAWRALVTARERLGDPAAAERGRRAYARTLRSLGVTPGPDAAVTAGRWWSAPPRP